MDSAPQEDGMTFGIPSSISTRSTFLLELRSHPYSILNRSPLLRAKVSALFVTIRPIPNSGGTMDQFTPRTTSSSGSEGELKIWRRLDQHLKGRGLLIVLIAVIVYLLWGFYVEGREKGSCSISRYWGQIDPVCDTPCHLLLWRPPRSMSQSAPSGNRLPVRRRPNQIPQESLMLTGTRTWSITNLCPVCGPRPGEVPLRAYDPEAVKSLGGGRACVSARTRLTTP
jgi:hypothetical protein